MEKPESDAAELSGPINELADGDEDAWLILGHPLHRVLGPSLALVFHENVLCWVRHGPHYGATMGHPGCTTRARSWSCR